MNSFESQGSSEGSGSALTLVPTPTMMFRDPNSEVGQVFSLAGITVEQALMGIDLGALASDKSGSGNRATLYDPAPGAPNGISVRSSLAYVAALIPGQVPLPPGLRSGGPTLNGSRIIPLLDGGSLNETMRELDLAMREGERGKRFIVDFNLQLVDIAETIRIWTISNDAYIVPDVKRIALTNDGSPGSIETIISPSGEQVQCLKLNLTVITDRYKSDLHTFYTKGPGLFLTLSGSKLTVTDLNIANQIQNLIAKTMELGMTSIDLKLGNTVINYGTVTLPAPDPQGLSEEVKDQLLREYSNIPGIDVRLIDVDSDFVQRKQTSIPGRVSSEMQTGESGEATAAVDTDSVGNAMEPGDELEWSSGDASLLGYWLMMILMSNHFYLFAQRNIMKDYFLSSHASLIGIDPHAVTTGVLFDHLTRLVLMWLNSSAENQQMPMSGDTSEDRDGGTGIVEAYPRLFVYYCNRVVPQGQLPGHMNEDFTLMGNAYFKDIPVHMHSIDSILPKGFMSPKLRECLAKFNIMMIRCFFLNSADEGYPLSSTYPPAELFAPDAMEESSVQPRRSERLKAAAMDEGSSGGGSRRDRKRKRTRRGPGRKQGKKTRKKSGRSRKKQR